MKVMKNPEAVQSIAAGREAPRRFQVVLNSQKIVSGYGGCNKCSCSYYSEAGGGMCNCGHLFSSHR